MVLPDWGTHVGPTLITVALVHELDWEKMEKQKKDVKAEKANRFIAV
jgi:hypothetical protein